MQTYPASQLLESLRQQTETLLQKAIREWQMAAPARFSAQPENGGWSAAQCLSHLNGYGLYYLPLLEAALKDAKVKKQRSATFRPGWLGDYFTKMMQPGADGSVGKKMKAFKQHVPPAGEDSDAVIALFIDQQEKLLRLLEEAEGLDLNRRRIPISIAKFLKLKTGDVFRFVIAHNLRHAAQAERVLKAAGAGAKAVALKRA
jgi:uncharacterized damage-inducible protein DinB